MNKSGLTAIKRKKISAPMKYLLDTDKIIGGYTLDFGSGHGFDADLLNMTKYDPNHGPKVLYAPITGYDTITCNYVLNVIDDYKERNAVLSQIRGLLSVKGKAYITVRRDIKKEGFTKRGTYQKNIKLNLPIVKETSGFCIYLLQKLSPSPFE